MYSTFAEVSCDSGRPTNLDYITSRLINLHLCGAEGLHPCACSPSSYLAFHIFPKCLLRQSGAPDLVLMCLAVPFQITIGFHV